MASTTQVLSRWSTLIEGFNTSTLQFYELVKKAVEKRQIPDATISKLELKEGGMFSSKREYLQVSYKKEFYFAICGSPFGNSFFISYWLLQPPDGFFARTFESVQTLTTIANAVIKPWTYYKYDTVSMFQTAVHTAVMEALDELVDGKDVPRLSEGDRKPIMREFFTT